MKQFLLYCVFGALGVSSDFAIFYMLNSAEAGYQFANLSGYGSGTHVSFFLNRAFNFDVKDKTAIRFTSFCAIAGLGYAASAMMLWYFVEKLGLDSNIAKLLTLPVVVALQFTLNKLITFRTIRAAA